MGLEIERKFLVDHEKWQNYAKPAGVHYRQGYLADEPHKTIRVRIAGDKGFITIKGASENISRKEFEYPIPASEAAELIDDFAEGVVEKTRYKIGFEGKVWEVDEFAGDNEGLIMAEVELLSENEAFKKPAWIAAEVSGDIRFYNSCLSRNPYKNWKDQP